MKNELKLFLFEEQILSKIYNIRGEKVMLDRDLADLYGVETKVLKQAVKRNIERFPKDFMFQMNTREFEQWKRDIVLSKADRQGLRYYPFCFTEQGVTMLSCILNSKTAVAVNIKVIRVFVKIRQYAQTHKEILIQLSKLEKVVKSHSRDIENIFLVLKELIDKQTNPVRRNKIGFKHYE